MSDKRLYIAREYFERRVDLSKAGSSGLTNILTGRGANYARNKSPRRREASLFHRIIGSLLFDS